MLRALIAALCLAVTGTAAAQDAEPVRTLAQSIAAEAQLRADRLARTPGAPAAAPAPGDTLMIELQEFALQSRRLSRAIGEAEGPEDLRCIFRGMSEDAETRTHAILDAQTRADQARAYLEIVRLTRQAEAILADLGSDRPEAPPSCPAG